MLCVNLILSNIVICPLLIINNNNNNNNKLLKKFIRPSITYMLTREHNSPIFEETERPTDQLESLLI